MTSCSSKYYNRKHQDKIGRHRAGPSYEVPTYQSLLASSRKFDFSNSKIGEFTFYRRRNFELNAFTNLHKVHYKQWSACLLNTTIVFGQARVFTKLTIRHRLMNEQTSVTRISLTVPKNFTIACM